MKIAMLAFVADALTASGAIGVDVLVMSAGSQPIDDAVVGALKAGGHKATLGPQYSLFTDQVDLGQIDVVYFQANYNWNAGAMPESGRSLLVDFIEAGGGMVTGEWATYEATGGYLGDLARAFPGRYTGGGAGAATTYTKETADPILNKGLPDSLEFPLDYFSGYETKFGTKCGAKVYYTSSNTGAPGLIGWNFGIGRVMSFSSCNAQLQMADPVFPKLLSNAVSWAALGGGQPGGFTADCDASGLLDLFDFLCFTNSFNAGGEYADCDGDGDLSLFDFLCFVNVFNNGC